MTSVLDAIPAAQRRASRQIRVASVPAGHVYVRHLSDPDGGDAVVRLAGHPARRRVPRAGRMVAAGHARRGLDRGAPRHVRRLPRALRVRRQDAGGAARRRGRAAACGRPARGHRPRPAQPAPPVARAARRAARGADRRAPPPCSRSRRAPRGRSRALGPRRRPCCAHPHVVDWDDAWLARAASTTGSWSGCTPRACAPTWTCRPSPPCWPTAVAGLPGRAAADQPPPRGVRARLALPRPGHGRGAAAARGASAVELREHDYFSDDELWAYLPGLDVSVLPYRFGTHSGWLEACADLGTAVIAPSCGFYAEQQPLFEYRHDEAGLDAGSLTAAVRAAYDARPAASGERGRAARAAACAERRARGAVRARCCG